MDYGGILRRLECKVCFQPYNSATSRPKLLPCGHSLCKQCLNCLIARGSDQIECPIDRKVHQVASVDALADNYDLLEALQAVELPCSEHKQALAVLYCQEQCLTLCEECRKRHNCPQDFALETTDISNLLQQALGNEPKTAQWDNQAKLAELQKRRNGPKPALENELTVCRFREVLPTRADLPAYAWQLSVNPRVIEAVTLTVSRDVVLSGVGIGRPVDSQRPTVVLYIRVYRDKELLYSCNNVGLSFHPNAKDQKVPISPPLPLSQGQPYTFKMKIQGSALYNGRPRSRLSPLLGPDTTLWQLSATPLHFPEVLSGPSWLGGPLLSLYYSPN